MYRRLNHQRDLWIAGILSAIFFCLVVALGGTGGSSRVAAANGVVPMPYSGGTDASQQPSTRFLVNPNRHAIVAASKFDRAPALDLDGGPGPATLPDEAGLLLKFAEKQFVAVVQRALNGSGTDGYNARAPPALI